MNSEKILLNDGNSIPKIGFGVYKIDGQHMAESIRAAYAVGYRLFDTASFYKNEEYLGSALKTLNIRRQDVQIATKAWTSEMGRQGVKDALHRSLEKLRTDYVDLYFIHWPVKDQELLRESWKSMEELKDEGLVRSVAVCNFKPHHLRTIEEGHKYLPVINQIERHPLLTQTETIGYGRGKNIVTEAWSPLMRGKKVMELDVVRRLAEKYGKTPAQIILNWDIQQGVVPIPKSTTPSRIEENIDVFDFALTQEELCEIDALNRDERSGKDPDNYEY